MSIYLDYGRMVRLLLVGATAVAVALPLGAAADDSRYGQWAPPGSSSSGSATAQTQGDDRTAALVKDLETLVDEAEKAKAADPRFLKDLRALAKRYSWPWSVSLVSDSFADGNYTASPTWSIASGSFSVTRGGGLRSVVKAVRQSRSTDQKAAEAILGAILNQGASGSAGGSGFEPGKPAAAYLGIANLANAFAIEITLQALPLSGEGAQETGAPRFEFGVYQGQSLVTGYRVAYEPSSSPSLMLTRGNSRGSSVIDVSGDKLNALDGRPRTLRVTRDKAGAMTVSADGRTVIQTTDRAFGDNFTGLVLENRAGDFEVTSVSVSAMP